MRILAWLEQSTPYRRTHTGTGLQQQVDPLPQDPYLQQPMCTLVYDEDEVAQSSSASNAINMIPEPGKERNHSADSLYTAETAPGTQHKK